MHVDIKYTQDRVTDSERCVCVCVCVCVCGKNISFSSVEFVQRVLKIVIDKPICTSAFHLKRNRLAGLVKRDGINTLSGVGGEAGGGGGRRGRVERGLSITLRSFHSFLKKVFSKMNVFKVAPLGRR